MSNNRSQMPRLSEYPMTGEVVRGMQGDEGVCIRTIHQRSGPVSYVKYEGVHGVRVTPAQLLELLVEENE